MSRKAQSYGNTIIELTLYMALLSIFLVALFNIFAAVLSAQTRSQAVSLVQSNGGFLVSKLSYDINQADNIVTPYSVGTSSTTLTIGVGTSNITYFLDNGLLKQTDSTGTFQLNDSDTSVSNLVFKHYGNDDGVGAVQINFTLTSLVVDNSETKSSDFQTVASTR